MIFMMPHLGQAMTTYFWVLVMKNERKTCAVIALCSVMMIAEIVGGSMFGSLVLVADGLHMSTHEGAMLIAALAYTYARKHVNDQRFVFGTGKLGELAEFSSAIILAMIALLIGYEAIARFMSPVPIHFVEAIPIAVVGLMVNIISVWFLSGGCHHDHSHGHDNGDEEEHSEELQYINTPAGSLSLSIFEDGIPPVFRIQQDSKEAVLAAHDVTVTSIRLDGKRQIFNFEEKLGFLESTT